MARTINRISKGAVISPMEVGQLDPVWLEAFEAWALDYEVGVQYHKVTDDIFAEFERKHGYKK